MARPRTNSVSKTITLTEDMLENAEIVSSRYGVSIPEYIRNLIFNDTRRVLGGIEILDEETEKELKEAREDYKKGRFTTLSSKKDIDDYFDKLSRTD